MICLRTVKIVFAEFGLLKKIISDAGMSFTSETFRQFCRQMCIEQAITSSFHYQNSGQVEVCIKFIKCTIKKYLDTNNDVNLTLLQIRSTPMSAKLPSPAMLLFNRPIRGLLPQMNRGPININNDDGQNEALKSHKIKYVKNNDTHTHFFLIGFTIAMQNEQGGPWVHVVIKEANSSDHRGRCYVIRVMKMG